MTREIVLMSVSFVRMKIMRVSVELIGADSEWTIYMDVDECGEETIRELCRESRVIGQYSWLIMEVIEEED